MKTAEEEAAQIVSDFMGQTLSTNKDVDDWLQLRIAQALTAYAEERVKEDRDKRTAEDLYKRSRELGRAEALEEAARLGEFHSCNGRCDGEEGCLGAIYKDIRALKGKP